MGEHFHYKAPPCPVCGKEDAARYGSSKFEPFDGMVCIERCGLLARDAIIAIRATDTYRRATHVQFFTGERIKKLERNALAAIFATEPTP